MCVLMSVDEYVDVCVECCEVCFRFASVFSTHGMADQRRNGIHRRLVSSR